MRTDSSSPAATSRIGVAGLGLTLVFGMTAGLGMTSDPSATSSGGAPLGQDAEIVVVRPLIVADIQRSVAVTHAAPKVASAPVPSPARQPDTVTRGSG